MSVDSGVCVGASDDNHTGINAEAPCFTPYADNICVLSHRTPGILGHGMSTNVIKVDKAFQ